MSNFPVFGANGYEGELTGTEVTPVPDGTVATAAPVTIAHLPDRAFLAPAQPTMMFRDRAAELEAQEAAGHRLLMSLNPKLCRARDRLTAKQAQVKYWASVVQLKEAEASRMRSLVQRAGTSLQYEDAEGLGTRQQRLSHAEDSLREAREEYCAAVEEMEAAQQQLNQFNGGK